MLSYTFADAELVKVVLQKSILTVDFAPRRLGSLYFLQVYSCHKC